MKPRILALLVVLAARANAADCLLGDADNRGAVSLGEVQQCVSNFLGASNPAPACPPAPGRFVDNGDGTVSDNLTGLMWLKKVAGNNFNGVAEFQPQPNAAGQGGIDALNYTYAEVSYGPCMSSSYDGVSTPPRGSPSAGGYCDWRMPSIAELRTILDANAAGCGMGSPCIDSLFGPTATTYYWSSSRFPSVADSVWAVDFYFGTVTYVNKYNSYAWRAVRGDPLP